MLHMVAKTFSPRRPFPVTHLPFVAKFYLTAFHGGATGLKRRALTSLFSLFYRAGRRGDGAFDYERFGQTKKIQFNGRNLQFQALYAPFSKHGYEPDVGLLLETLLREGGTFFDVGSNWGFFSLEAARQRRQLTVHAFEPMPGTFRDLVSCVEQAGIKEFVTCHHAALSATDGEAFIRLPDGLHSGQAMLSNAGGTARINTRRLDSLKLPSPDFIKIDVEGHEIEVLRGAVETLRNARPFLVFENKPFGGEDERTLEPLFFLAALGYELFVPAIRRTRASAPYLLSVGGQRPQPGDEFTLLPLKPGERLLWKEDLNIFACPASRVDELAAAFKA